MKKLLVLVVSLLILSCKQTCGSCTFNKVKSKSDQEVSESIGKCSKNTSKCSKNTGKCSKDESTGKSSCSRKF